MDAIPCTYRISMKAMVRDSEGRVMLVREADGKWELPGGGLDHGENPRDGLAREIREEIGCDVASMSESPVAFWTIRKEVGSPSLKWFAFVAYDVKLEGAFDSEIHANDEVQEVKYFSFDEMKTLDLHDNVKPLLELRLA